MCSVIRAYINRATKFQMLQINLVCLYIYSDIVFRVVSQKYGRGLSAAKLKDCTKIYVHLKTRLQSSFYRSSYLDYVQ